jgi:hypothetical protein
MLTNVGTTMGGLKSYHLVVDDEDDSEAEKLEEYVGHKVEIRGKATDEGDATVKQTTKVKIEGPGGDRETETEGKLKADADGVPFLGVESVRRISKSCP